MSKLWYAARSKPNKEGFLTKQLEARNIKVFFPFIRVVPVNPRSRNVRPYFPNYVFVHLDLDEVNASFLHWMPGASGLVSFGGEPASVPDLLIASLQQQLIAYNSLLRDATNDPKPGDLVVIQEGPFEGYEAIFDVRLSGSDRVRVLLNFLQARIVPVELNSRQIRRVKRS